MVTLRLSDVYIYTVCPYVVFIYVNLTLALIDDVKLNCKISEPHYIYTYARLGPLRQQIKGSERDSEAGGLHSWRLPRPSPQQTSKLSYTLQASAALVLHSNQGQQEGHQRAEKDAQQRAPSSENTAAGVAPHRYSSHNGPELNPPYSGDTVPHMLAPQLGEPKGGSQEGKHGQRDSWELSYTTFPARK